MELHQCAMCMRLSKNMLENIIFASILILRFQVAQLASSASFWEIRMLRLVFHEHSQGGVVKAESS